MYFSNLIRARNSHANDRVSGQLKMKTNWSVNITFNVTGKKARIESKHVDKRKNIFALWLVVS